MADVTMTDERLGAIEEHARYLDQQVKLGLVFHRRAVPELTAEIRRLRRENRLLHLSRGSAPDDEGLD